MIILQLLGINYQHYSIIFHPYLIELFIRFGKNTFGTIGVLQVADSLKAEPKGSEEDEHELVL